MGCTLRHAVHIFGVAGDVDIRLVQTFKLVRPLPGHIVVLQLDSARCIYPLAACVIHMAALQLDPNRIRQFIGQRFVLCILPLLFHLNIHQLVCRVGKGGGDGCRIAGNRAAHAIVHVELCVSGCTGYAFQAAIGGRCFNYPEACANGDAGNCPAFANGKVFCHFFAVRAAQADTANVAEGDGKRVAACQRRCFVVRLFLFNYQRTDLDGVNELDLQFGEFFFRRGVTAEHQRICVWLAAVVVAAC